MAGLSAALAAQDRGFRVILHEAGRRAGGRCGAFHDPCLGQALDLGTHVLLGGNPAALGFIESLGQSHRLIPCGDALPFADLRTGARWSVPVSGGLIRAFLGTEGCSPHDLMRLAWRLLRAGNDDLKRTTGGLALPYRRLIEPLALAVMNAPPERVSGHAFATLLIRLFRAGAGGLRPLRLDGTLEATLIGPALARFRARGGVFLPRDPLLDLAQNESGWVARFQGGSQTFDPQSPLILALPLWETKRLLPGLITGENVSSAIATLHYRLETRPCLPGMATLMGLAGGQGQWLAPTERGISVTISAFEGSHHALGRETLAARIWAEIAPLMAMAGDPLPKARVVIMRRATATLAPGSAPPGLCQPGGLVLAGGWTRPPLPDTIETAIESGLHAVDLLAPGPGQAFA